MAYRMLGAKPLYEPTLGLLSIGTSGTNFYEILIEIKSFLIKKMHFKMSSAKWRPVRLGLNVFNHIVTKNMEPERTGVSESALRDHTGIVSIVRYTKY